MPREETRDGREGLNPVLLARALLTYTTSQTREFTHRVF